MQASAATIAKIFVRNMFGLAPLLPGGWLSLLPGGECQSKAGAHADTLAKWPDSLRLVCQPLDERKLTLARNGRERDKNRVQVVLSCRVHGASPDRATACTRATTSESRGSARAPGPPRPRGAPPSCCPCSAATTRSRR